MTFNTTKKKCSSDLLAKEKQARTCKAKTSRSLNRQKAWLVVSAFKLELATNGKEDWESLTRVRDRRSNKLPFLVNINKLLWQCMLHLPITTASELYQHVHLRCLTLSDFRLLGYSCQPKNHPKHTNSQNTPRGTYTASKIQTINP